MADGAPCYDTCVLKRILLALAAVTAIVVVAVLALAARGSRGPIDLRSASPSERRICLSQEPRGDRELLDRCFRVRGTLLHVWRERDGEGRLVDLHLLVVARLHLYVVKVHEPFPARTRLGHEVLVIGPLVRPHPEHLGIHEIEGFFLSGEGL
jgi:hypothetical protein